MLTVSEVFGPTVQGEGPSAGRRCVFIRLGLCNLDCSWCDTPYTWDWTGKNGPPQDRSLLDRVEVTDLLARAAELSDPCVLVISGGEPLVQRAALGPLVMSARARGWEVEIETNGTLAPTIDLAAWVTRWNVSPKLPHSGVPSTKAIVPEALRTLADLDACFKVVAATPADIDLAHGLLCEQLGIPTDRVWIMPEGRDAPTITARLAALADRAIARGFNLTTRLHVLAWGDERGR